MRFVDNDKHIDVQWPFTLKMWRFKKNLRDRGWLYFFYDNIKTEKSKNSFFMLSNVPRMCAYMALKGKDNNLDVVYVYILYIYIL